MSLLPRWVSLRPDLERGAFRSVSTVRSWRHEQTTVLFDPRRGVRYTLEGDGERIWMLLRNGAPMQGLVDQLFRERELPVHRLPELYADTAVVLDQLLRAGLIEQEPGALPGETESRAESAPGPSGGHRGRGVVEPDVRRAPAAPPSTVVILVTSPLLTGKALAAIEPFASVELAPTIAEIHARLQRGVVAALVVTTFEDAEGVLIADSLDAISARHPWLPMYLYRESVDPGRLDEMVARGWRLALVVGLEQLVSVLRDAVSSGSMIERLAREVQPLGALLPENLVQVLDGAAKSAVEGRPAGDLAEGMNVTREDLRHALAEAGWPPPKVIITWFRRILAGILLARPGATVHEVATALGYRSPRSLSKLFEPLPGFAPRELLGRDRAGEVRALFEASISARRRDT